VRSRAKSFANTAKPLFTGSIPIAASNLFNNKRTSVTGFEPFLESLQTRTQDQLINCLRAQDTTQTRIQQQHKKGVYDSSSNANTHSGPPPVMS
jgi:hypothetical protein